MLAGSRSYETTSSSEGDSRPQYIHTPMTVEANYGATCAPSQQGWFFKCVVIFERKCIWIRRWTSNDTARSARASTCIRYSSTLFEFQLRDCTDGFWWMSERWSGDLGVPCIRRRWGRSPWKVVWTLTYENTMQNKSWKNRNRQPPLINDNRFKLRSPRARLKLGSRCWQDWHLNWIRLCAVNRAYF